MKHELRLELWLNHRCLHSVALLQSKHEQCAAFRRGGHDLLADLAKECWKGGRAADDDGDILLAVDRVGDRAGADAASKILPPEHLAGLRIDCAEIACRLPENTRFPAVVSVPPLNGKSP